MTDLVVIHVDRKKPNEVFALFPTAPADNNGTYCNSYQHIGQHGAADYRHCINISRPATPEEAAPLLEELRRIGYDPQVIERALYRHHQQRIKLAKNIVGAT
jgi:hypothetical protein